MTRHTEWGLLGELDRDRIEAECRERIEELAGDVSWWEGMFDDVKLPDHVSMESLRFVMRMLAKGYKDRLRFELHTAALMLVEDAIAEEMREQGVEL